jgi:hypothetical protein
MLNARAKRAPNNVVASLSAVLLIASHESPIDNWHFLGMKVQLQVWIAAFSTISNGLLAYGFAEGVAIRFWHLAQCGTTVSISPTPRLPIFRLLLLPVVVDINSGLIRFFPPGF